MVESIADPGEERVHFEKCVLLSELIKLGVSVQEARRDELVEDTHRKRRQNGEEHVVE